MITVHEFPGAWGVPSVSPFCLKLTTWLRMAGVEYESVQSANPTKSPKGKLPYIEDDGSSIADTTFVIEHLTRKHHLELDAFLDEEQRTNRHLLKRTFEESLYFVFVYLRWMTDGGWREIQEAYFGSMPAVPRLFVPSIARRQVRRTLWGHGIGRHSEAEVNAVGVADIEALSAVLGELDFFFGRPSGIDATAYGFLENIRSFPVASVVRERLLEHENLVAFCDRVRDRYWPTDEGSDS